MSWGTTNLTLTATTMAQIADALKLFAQTGQVVSVAIPPHYTVAFQQLTSCGMKLRELVISSPMEVDRNTMVWIASCFGFNTTPQHWSVCTATDGDVYHTTILQAGSDTKFQMLG